MIARIVDLATLTAESVREGALEGRNVTVLGLARSGVALARFFADAGAHVTVYDRRTTDDLAAAVASLGGRQIELSLGPEVEPATTWAAADLIATSPSINPDFPTAEPRLREALAEVVAAHRDDPEHRPPLVSEADLVLRLCPCPTIGVTGTKGKTTTASLAAALLAGDPVHPVVLGGNMGIPLVEQLTELTPDHRVVIELSELQLPTLSKGTTVAVYTNVTADHLDRHGSVEAYRMVKRRLAELVDPAGALVLNADDPVVREYRPDNGAATVTYRRGLPVPPGMGIREGWIVASAIGRLPAAGGNGAHTGAGGLIMPVAELKIPGDHNVSNAMAAISAALLFGVEPEAIRRAAAAFEGVEHRLEIVATVDGIRFVNDSQATQPDAVIAGLRAFPRPLVLIGGGRGKGVDLSALGPVAAQRADAAVLIGESGPALGEIFRAVGMRRVESATTLEAAVLRADAIARELLALTLSGIRPGRPEPIATVLMSPAAASFDMFVDYAARGRAFKAAVAALAERRRGGGGGA